MCSGRGLLLSLLFGMTVHLRLRNCCSGHRLARGFGRTVRGCRHKAPFSLSISNSTRRMTELHKKLPSLPGSPRPSLISMPSLLVVTNHCLNLSLSFKARREYLDSISESYKSMLLFWKTKSNNTLRNPYRETTEPRICSLNKPKQRYGDGLVKEKSRKISSTRVRY